MRSLSVVPGACLVFALAGLSAGAASVTAAPPAGQEVPPEQRLAMRLFERLAGVPLSLDDARLAPMADLVKAGKLLDAAQIPQDDDHFYDLTLKMWALAMSNKAETPFVGFNDFAAMVVGVARDDLDARSLLTGNFTYVGADNLGLPGPSPGDDEVYRAIEGQRLKLRTALVRQEPQRADLDDAAGVLTSRAWAEAHLKDGTNRRALQYTFQEFLCAPIASWKDASLPDYHVRRDVTREPGSDPGTYEGVCRACHAPMDAMGGAYARYDFQNGQLVYAGASHVVAKVNKNAQNYPGGWAVEDDSWLNLLPQSATAPEFGWRGATSGNGLGALGAMVANASAFSQCLAKRAFSAVCKRDPGDADRAELAQAAGDFEASGYKLRRLFADVATLPACLGTAAGN